MTPTEILDQLDAVDLTLLADADLEMMLSRIRTTQINLHGMQAKRLELVTKVTTLVRDPAAYAKILEESPTFAQIVSEAQVETDTVIPT